MAGFGRTMQGRRPHKLISEMETPVSNPPTCTVIRPGNSFDGKQGLSYVEGISAESVGSTGICMHLLTIPPGGEGRMVRLERRVDA